MAHGTQASNVLFGYLEGVHKRDAEAYARAFARRCLKTSERCWYSVEPLWNGFLYEIHEGGPGFSYLPELAREIDANPGGIALLPSGRRVFEVTVRNGRPVGALLSEGKSRQVQTHMAVVQPTVPTDGRPVGMVVPAWVPHGHVRFQAIRTTRRMKRVGLPVSLPLAAGGVAFATGFAMLVAGGITYASAPQRVPQARAFDAARLPHRQWETVMASVTAASFAAKLEFRDGRWTVETAPDPQAPQQSPSQTPSKP